MNRITISYSHDYENDTKIVYSFNEEKSFLDCSFTSEDPDYGTDTITLERKPPMSLADMVTELRLDMTEYLDDTDDGIKRPGNAREELENWLGNYSNSTLFAVENALRVIEGEPDAMINVNGNLIQIMTIRDAAKHIKGRLQCGDKVYFAFGVGVDKRHLKEFSKEPTDLIWYGVRGLANDGDLFDGYKSISREMIILCGHYGGGSVSMAYYDGDYDYIAGIDPEADQLVKAMCESCGSRNDKERILLETIELEKEEN